MFFYVYYFIIRVITQALLKICLNFYQHAHIKTLGLPDLFSNTLDLFWKYTFLGFWVLAQ